MLQRCRPTLAWLVPTPAAPAKGRAGDQNNLHSKESHIIISHKIHAYCFDDALQVHQLQTRLPPPPGPRHLCNHLQVSSHLEEITGKYLGWLIFPNPIQLALAYLSLSRSSEFSSSNATCLSCHASCSECFGPGSNHCLTCPPNHSLASGAKQRPSFNQVDLGYVALISPGSCLPSCPPGQHKVAGSPACIACHSSCATCSGPGMITFKSSSESADSGPASCSSCSSSAQLRDGFCSSCEDGCFSLLL